MKEFYYLQRSRKKKEILIEPKSDYDPKDIMLGIASTKDPFLVKIDEGKNFYDVLYFQDAFNFIISERFYFLLKENNITGWRSYSVDITGADENYYGIQISGRCGNLIEPKERGFYTGYSFDNSTWDGSDLFCPEGTLLIFCSEKLEKIVKNNKISNIELLKISEVEVYSIGQDSIE